MSASYPSHRACYLAILSGGSLPDGLDGLLEPWPDPPSPGIESLEARLLELRAEEEYQAGSIFTHIGRERILLGYVPAALVEGGWLASAVEVRHSHDELGQACLGAWYLESGEGEPALHRGNLYRAQLGALGLSPPTLEGLLSREDERLCEDDFALALVGLRLGRSSVRTQQDGGWLPEVLGFHAAYVELGPPALVRCALEDTGGRYLGDRSPGTSGQIRAQEAARRCLLALLERWPSVWPRLWRGASALLRSRLAWYASLRPPPSPREALAAMLVRKVRHARGRHGGVLLDGRALEDWFDPKRFNVDAFLDALARSPWVRPGDPERSLLLTRLLAFGGPMFGVFSPEEERVLRRWIQDLPSLATTNRRVSDIDQLTPVQPPPLPPSTPTPSPSVRRRGKASLYRSLLLGDTAHARRIVLRSLARVKNAGEEERLKAQGLWPYTWNTLAEWVERRMQAQLGDPARGLGLAQGLSRQQVCWLLLQLAPAALVDGAWLQGMTRPENSHRPEAGWLLRIYYDELGAGVVRQHHGNVLRKTLAAQGIELPPCDSEAFEQWPGLLPEAFAMPVLWLSFAQCSGEFLPELLGLNLAIEMAGVGETYRIATQLLRRHGIDPYFFQLHETIDNAASGHTAWSTEVIGLHLEQASCQGKEAVSRSWQRIWQGYATYEATSASLVRAVAARLGPGLAWGWLKSTVSAAIRWS
ncbi:MAG: iron-containing redox enzyme family protein [Myxococcales bacterium]|nr:iron-containing redox enzyme family protein [Polyangiaceae bacterium]MDW8251917.1 iron-containing redox enzyme family protein [Myxococcales bacterium]